MFFSTHALISLLSFASNAIAGRYILTPKTGVDHSVSLGIMAEHDLHPFATFGTLPFFTATQEQFLQYQNTLQAHFDIEEDVTIVLGNATDFVLADSRSTVPWHLQRIVQTSLPLNGTFPYTECNSNAALQVNNYVVDTGIDTSHPEFEGRASWGANFADGTDTDCNNHGTHVAGLIGSRTYGVCKDANLIAVKVLDCQGSGSLSGVIRGIEHVYKLHKNSAGPSNKTVKSIINMSLGGGFSSALNRAVEACVSGDRDFYIVVAAGNENQDACNASPASASNILTVMASDVTDHRAWFSNWGTCADLYAPGVDVESTIPHGRTASYSGTSMASPVTCGVLTHYINMYPTMDMKGIRRKMLKGASKNVIQSNIRETSNLLVHLRRA